MLKRLQKCQELLDGKQTFCLYIMLVLNKYKNKLCCTVNLCIWQLSRFSQRPPFGEILQRRQSPFLLRFLIFFGFGYFITVCSLRVCISIHDLNVPYRHTVYYMKYVLPFIYLYCVSPDRRLNTTVYLSGFI
jgi:hypothetical protein